jgi:hypothetical protein
MTKQDDHVERRVRALLRSEAAAHERLQALRSGLIKIVESIDGLTLRRRRRKRAGKPAGAGTTAGTLLPFRRPGETS